MLNWVLLRAVRWLSVWHVPEVGCGCCRLELGHIAVWMDVVAGWLEKGSLDAGLKCSCLLSAYRCRLAGVMVQWLWCVGNQVSLLSEG